MTRLFWRCVNKGLNYLAGRRRYAWVGMGPCDFCGAELTKLVQAGPHGGNRMHTCDRHWWLARLWRISESRLYGDVLLPDQRSVW